MEEAGAAAIRLVQGEPTFRKMVEGYSGNMPDLTIDKVVETQGIGVDTLNQSGYAFYEDE